MLSKKTKQNINIFDFDKKATGVIYIVNKQFYLYDKRNQIAHS